MENLKLEVQVAEPIDAVFRTLEGCCSQTRSVVSPIEADCLKLGCRRCLAVDLLQTGRLDIERSALARLKLDCSETRLTVGRAYRGGKSPSFALKKVVRAIGGAEIPVQEKLLLSAAATQSESEMRIFRRLGMEA